MLREYLLRLATATWSQVESVARENAVTWYVENAGEIVARERERPKQRKGRPNRYGRGAFENWSSLLSRKGDSLQRALGVKVGRILGCGRYGCTVASDHDRVIKLSLLPDEEWEHNEELRFWTKMMEEQKRPDSPASAGVVKVEDVWVVTDAQTKQRYMVTLRDAVEPFIAMVPDDRSHGYEMPAPTEASVLRGVVKIPRGVVVPSQVRNLNISSRVNDAIDPVLLATNEYNLDDVHIGNIGWQGDRLVIYDAGYSGRAPLPERQLRVNKERPRQELTNELPAWGVTFNEWSDFIAHKGDDLERALGAKVGPILGCGAFGCVVASDQGRVIKLSSATAHGGDDSELAFWTRMKDEQKRADSPASKGIVRIDKIASVTDKDTGEMFVAVLREDVEPFYDSEKNTLTPATTRRSGVARWLEVPDANIWELPQAQDAGEAVYEYQLDDVHPGNLGWSGDRLVVYDAHSREAPLKEDVRLRVNQKLEHAKMKRNAYDPFDLESKTVAEELDERARKAEQGDWYPASGGAEQPFRTRTGRRLQYVWQPSTGNHAYYDLDADLILSDEDAQLALDMFNQNAAHASGRWDSVSQQQAKRRMYERGIREGATPEQASEVAEEAWRWMDDEGHFLPLSDAPRAGSAPSWWKTDSNALGGLTENSRGFYVFEMSGEEPLRQVNVAPLTKTKAEQLARIGAQKGKHARAVTTDPRRDDFKIVATYPAGYAQNAQAHPADDGPVNVRFYSLSGPLKQVREATYPGREAALAAVTEHAESAGYSGIRAVPEDDGVRYTARTPGGRPGRTVASGDYYE